MALSDLFGSGKAKKKTENEEDTLLEELKNQKRVQQIAVEKIVPNRFQPRKVFDEEKLDELARTIHIHGLIQPIILRKYEEDKYEIIAGERRFRAMQKLTWTEVPAIVQEMSDNETASVALIENLQREELTAIEEAEAYQGLMALNELTQEALAQRIGKSQSFIANKLRLLRLAEPLKEALLNRKITERHGRSMLALSHEEQIALLSSIVEKKLTVKETERLVKQQLAEKNKSQEQPKKRIRKISKDLRLALNTINKSVDLIKETGMPLEAKEEDLGDVYRITIEIKKDK
ncbi:MULTISPECIES: nucleoid occlusion protein [Carnobacterium]|uniref:Chromosome partitioning protein ParB n=2 Tax=Carnobacterium inhibens TaxID=147709 RepID=U5SCH2_9LACT|nr:MULTISPECIES: nucleoid occlusion protein [Carnobacterium]AGY82726.1 chromosome partitioning protein ParB [Carnobacterium inhibens subsp. gilichinskyi]MBC9825528.1 nucleoid occlusion protein [Carnobacterium inhibens]MCM3513077.1 nucleoid occlusion protein [Carnobacterium inhibens]MDN5371821.1 ParB family transcriptional regulator, chromosome partitioning protein [Carnobacterium sp.]